MKLIFVYNAASGMMASLVDSVHKAVSPGTYPCNLCRITYGSVAMKTDWKDFIASLPYVSEFLHKDEFAARYPNLKDTPFPAIFAESESGMKVLVSAVEINKARDIAGLKELVKSALALSPKHDETTMYRCPECGLRYRDKEMAEKCETWCREYQSCNIDIVKQAVKEQTSANDAKS